MFESFKSIFFLLLLEQVLKHKMEQLSELIRTVQSGNVQKREESLLELRKRTKDSEDISLLHRLKFGDVLFELLEEWKTKYQVVVLSILANCTNLNEQWREFVRLSISYFTF